MPHRDVSQMPLVAMIAVAIAADGRRDGAPHRLENVHRLYVAIAPIPVIIV